MGIINMMIVALMLIHSVTFGWVYTDALGDDPDNAITFDAILPGVAAIATPWIQEPPIVRDVDEVVATPATDREVRGHEQHGRRRGGRRRRRRCFLAGPTCDVLIVRPLAPG